MYRHLLFKTIIHVLVLVGILVRCRRAEPNAGRPGVLFIWYATFLYQLFRRPELRPLFYSLRRNTRTTEVSPCSELIPSRTPAGKGAVVTEADTKINEYQRCGTIWPFYHHLLVATTVISGLSIMAVFGVFGVDLYNVSVKAADLPGCLIVDRILSPTTLGDTFRYRLITWL